MSKPVIFVIGASGSVGSATIATLSEKYVDQVEIKAGVRNPDKATKLRAIPNVEIVQATMGDSNLASTLNGVSTLYIVTPPTEDCAQLAISTAESAKQAGVKHIAVVSVQTAEFTENIFGQQFHTLETKIAELGVPYTLVRLPMFMENYWAHKSTIVSEGVVYSSIDPNVVFTSATVEDIGKASAAILVNPEKHVDQTLIILSDRHSYNNFIKEMSDEIGKEIKYVQLSYEDAQKRLMDAGFPELRAKGLIELFRLINASSPALTRGDLTIVERLTGEEPTNLKQWVAKYSGEFK